MCLPSHLVRIQEMFVFFFFLNPTPQLIIFQMQKAQCVVSGFLESILERYINNIKH